MKNFFREFNRARRIILHDNPSAWWTNFRVWIGLKILPKDLSNFILILISKIGLEYEKLESEKKEKISSIEIDFETRD